LDQLEKPLLQGRLDVPAGHPDLLLHHGKFAFGPHAWCEDDEGHIVDLTVFECWRLDHRSVDMAVDRQSFFSTFAPGSEAIYCRRSYAADG
jgi:hypothetical protein